MNTLIDSADIDRSTLLWRLVEKLDEQRQYPRLPAALAVKLRNTQGESVELTALNVSPDGLQLRCEVAAARLLHPSGGRVQPGEDPLLAISMRLAAGRQERWLSAECELLYLTTVDTEPRCVVGLKFVDFAPGSEQLLSAFICEQMGVAASAYVA